MRTKDDHAVLSAMALHGGHFVQGLAELGFRADDDNLAKIKATWPLIWDEFERVFTTNNRNKEQPCLMK